MSFLGTLEVYGTTALLSWWVCLHVVDSMQATLMNRDDGTHINTLQHACTTNNRQAKHIAFVCSCCYTLVVPGGFRIQASRSIPFGVGIEDLAAQ